MVLRWCAGVWQWSPKMFANTWSPQPSLQGRCWGEKAQVKRMLGQTCRHCFPRARRTPSLGSEDRMAREGNAPPPALGMPAIHLPTAGVGGWALPVSHALSSIFLRPSSWGRVGGCGGARRGLRAAAQGHARRRRGHRGGAGRGPRGRRGGPPRKRPGTEGEDDENNQQGPAEAELVQRGEIKTARRRKQRRS